MLRTYIYFHATHSKRRDWKCSTFFRNWVKNVLLSCCQLLLPRDAPVLVRSLNSFLEGDFVFPLFFMLIKKAIREALKAGISLSFTLTLCSGLKQAQKKL